MLNLGYRSASARSPRPTGRGRVRAGGGPANVLWGRRLRDPTAHWLVRFGYDGSEFHGWARQPGLRTVEGEILRGLARNAISSRASRPGLRVASRTDRGVSARANALTLSSPLTGTALLRALNGIAPDLFFSAATAVPDGFRVREPVRRTYRYFEAVGVHRIARWRAGARLFAGDVDVRSFGREIPSAVPTRRTLEALRVTARGPGLVLEVTGRSFVWGMVRKIVAALREVDAERLSLETLAAAIAGRARLTLPLAEPEPLVLWEVEFPVRWAFRASARTRGQARWWDGARAALWTRRAVLQALLAAVPRAGRPGAPAGPGPRRPGRGR